MPDTFFSLPATEQIAFIKKTGNQLDIPDIIIEKDLWLCWLLEQIFALPIPMVFKGGTSLSKVFGLIKRFSEDCDITIDYRHFNPQLDLEHTSRTQLKKISAQLKEQLRIYILETVLPYLKEQAFKNFPDKKFEITLSEDGEQLRFYYPSLISMSPGYLRDHVFMEFGIRNSVEPCEKHPVISYLEQAVSNNFILPKPTINILSPLRTFWEKATLIHVECHRDRLVKTPERLSRHWYDLYMLTKAGLDKQALTNHEILKRVIEYKKAFFNTSYANYNDCLSRKFRLIPLTSYLENLKQDFRQMIAAGMFHESPPTFDEILSVLRSLEITINKR